MWATVKLKSKASRATYNVVLLCKMKSFHLPQNQIQFHKYSLYVTIILLYSL